MRHRVQRIYYHHWAPMGVNAVELSPLTFILLGAWTKRSLSMRVFPK